MFRSVAGAIRTAPRGLKHARRHASTSSHSHRSVHRGLLWAGAGTIVALSTALYLQSRPLVLDTQGRAAVSKTKRARKDIPYAEVQKHNTPGDCWVVLDGKVYDLTSFASKHPGGAGIIYAWAGRDATALFNPVHSPGIIDDRLLSEQPSAYIGDVDPTTLPPPPPSHSTSPSAPKREIDLSEIVGLPDFDEAAESRMSDKGWAYISAGATDMASLAENRKAWNDVWFRPRVLVDVSDVDMSTSFLGNPTSAPFFICPTGMSKLAGPEGEPGLAAVAGEEGIVQFVSTNSSAPLSAILEGRSRNEQVQFFQLYVDKNRENSKKLLDQVNAHPGMKAVFVTVDCAVPGKREADERNRSAVGMGSGTSGGVVQADKRGGGVGRTTGQYLDASLTWSDLAWIRQNTRLPLGVKGIQCVEDAVRCADLGVDAIYLSNHGGRSLDTSPPALYTLLELRKLRPDVFEKCEVYVDGGVRRGTDVIKALCLGARGVGMARPFLYALTYGQEGVRHAIDIMRDEIEVTMKLLGVSRLDQLGPHLVNTRALDDKIVSELQWGPKEQFKPKGA